MKGSAISTTLLLGVVYTYWEYLVYAIVVLAAAMTIMMTLKLVRWISTLRRGMGLRDVD